MRIAPLLMAQPLDTALEVKGWVRTRRDAKGGFSFLEINDGSCLANLQVVADSGLVNYESEIKRLTTGCAVRVAGDLVVSPARGQAVELRCRELTVYGWAPAETYPLQKKHHSFEFLRSMTHLRPRTNSLAAVARIRSALALALHRFFAERGFFYVHTPIITTNDCEGAGEMFTVTALDLNNLPRQDDRVDFSRDFFGRQASLTVSGQLEAEAYALALGNVYTFGPTFRAEHSNTSRHLAEFWMVEPEMAFCDLAGDVDLAEEFLKYLLASVQTECAAELTLFGQFIDPGLHDRLAMVLEQDFARITYTEAVDRLLKADRAFEFPVRWGADLQSEHERYLAEEVFKRPVVVTDYPRAIKPFYMRTNDDGRTVAAMDILLPGVGELIGGSQREERYDVLLERLAETGLRQEDYEWYLDLRRYGSAPHAGFGMGFERLVQFATGMANIREVIPFPRAR
ncbi:MAG: asparagine--tRNA ligase [Deltaproteobacteria bacterium CG23_combo_of_CG06-09_8_20_14_all_60_8]|nr:MAG: asparagine--tRNA ligase [Desulfobacterales bacterium CG2_30_60_27]PIP43194.1 MAG: asparagine--tRNA ligase [Deltaproteobacteria bacterium CG23_combo_of_CG06-09_8_20_14_all_60_8]